MVRLGGNRWSTFNWENNASNAGRDWHHQNDGYLSESAAPGDAILAHARPAWKQDRPVLATIPIGDYVAADRQGNGDVHKSGPDFLSSRFHRNVFKQSQHWAPPNLNDHEVSQTDLISFLRRQAPQENLLWFSLDNEPDLWHETHPRIHPKRISRKHLLQRSLECAEAIKQAAPHSLIFGPAVSGWMGITRFEETPLNHQDDFVEEYLHGFAERERQTGKRCLDVLDVHWYPEHRGGNTRVTADSAEEPVALARSESARSLYDPDFIENSWITRDVLKAPIQLLPRLQSAIKRKYPGTRLAITEYYFGGGADISGALAQADVLGALGSHGVFCACLFPLGTTDHRFIHAVFDLFRPGEGIGLGFGNTAIRVHSDQSESCRVYAALRDSQVVTTIAINRTAAAQKVEWNFSNASPRFASKHLEGFQITSRAPRPVAVFLPMSGTESQPITTFPPRSVTMIVWNVVRH
jgi:hypothetical protein